MNLSATFSKKEITLLCVVFCYILYVCFPLFADLTGIPPTIPALVVCVYLGVAYRPYLFSKSLSCFLFYILLLTLYGFVGHKIWINGIDIWSVGWKKALIVETAWILPAILIMTVLCRLNNHKIIKFVGIGSVVFLSLSFLYILPLMSSSIGYLRDEATLETLGVKPLGLPNYTLMHAYVFITSPLLWQTKYCNGKEKIIMALVSLLFCYIVINTTITTSLVVLVMNIILVIVLNYNNKQKSILLVFIVGFVFLLLYYSGIIISVIDHLIVFFEGTGVEGKLLDLKDSIKLGAITGDNISGRVDIHQESKDNFFNNPLFGTGFPGGHSKILDTFGSYGLLGGIPFLLMIYYSFKIWMTILPQKKERYSLAMSFLSAFIFLYVKGVFGDAGWLFMFVICPSFIKACEKEIN